jgi:hypothetical protein
LRRPQLLQTSAQSKNIGDAKLNFDFLSWGGSSHSPIVYLQLARKTAFAPVTDSTGAKPEGINFLLPPGFSISWRSKNT